MLRPVALFRGLIIGMCLLVLAMPAYPRSAGSPRHSGTEPPGGPRSIEALPGRAISRTPDGGMGYVDAYGNGLTDRQPQEKKPRHRPRPGAYGGPPKVEDNRLPDVDAGNGNPVWSFR